MRQGKIKVYCVGTSTSYTSWLDCELVTKMEDADLVFFTGGEDVGPMWYKEGVGKMTRANSARDNYEVSEAYKAMKLGKNIFGTCRGIQLGCVMSGGKLIQHMNHPYSHAITLYDGTIVQTNSLHHQLQKPYNLHPTEYVVAGHSLGLSNVYLNGNNENVLLPTVTKGDKSYSKEPELVFYRKTNWLGIQGHPEMMDYNAPLCNILRGMVDLQIEGKLDLVLTMGIPTSRYVGTKLLLHDDEQQQYDQIFTDRQRIYRELALALN